MGLQSFEEYCDDSHETDIATDVIVVCVCLES